MPLFCSATNLPERHKIRESIQTTLSTPNTDLIEGCRETIAKLKEELQKYLEPKIELQQVTEQHDLFEAREEVLREVDVNEKPRRRILDDISRAERAIVTEEAKVRQAGTTELDMLALAVSKWDPYDQNACSDFFDADWMFNVRDGFDIVIGNPPYLQLQKNQGAYALKYKDCGYQTYSKSGDIYMLFAERAAQLACTKGAISLIIPNKWMLAEYGASMRKTLLQYRMIQVLNFGDVQFFENAATIVCIIMFTKDTPTNNCLVLSVNQKIYACSFDATITTELKDYAISTFTDEHWLIIDERQQSIINKITRSTNSTILRDLPIEINYGIKPGLTKAYIVNEEQAEAILKSCKSAEERIKTQKLIIPILLGRDLQPYYTKEPNLRLLNVHNGVRGAIRPIDINDYPAIKKYQRKFHTQLQKRKDKGATDYNLRNCAYLMDFAKAKIIYPEITSRFQFTYDEKGYFCNNKAFIIVSNDNILLKFLTGIFNSKISKLWIWHHCPELLGGTREIRKVFFEKYPVPNMPEAAMNRIVSIVNTIIVKKEVDSNAEIEPEKLEIDDILAEFYELTDDEKIALQAFVDFLPNIDNDNFELSTDADEKSGQKTMTASIPMQSSSELEDDFIE